MISQIRFVGISLNINLKDGVSFLRIYLLDFQFANLYFDIIYPLSDYLEMCRLSGHNMAVRSLALPVRTQKDQCYISTRREAILTESFLSFPQLLSTCQGFTSTGNTASALYVISSSLFAKQPVVHFCALWAIRQRCQIN